MVDPITTGVGLVGMAWAAKKVLGPTLDALGEDLKTLYRDRSTRIINRAVNKIDDPEDGKCANLRIVRDVLWNGAYSESEVFTEYYAGVLAASRSKDGLDDGMAPFVDAVKSLSTSQLKLHYDIYCSLERMLNQSYESGLRFNVSSVQTTDVFLPRFGSPVDLQVMLRNGLITEFTIDYEILTSQESERACPYLRTRPTRSYKSFVPWLPRILSLASRPS